ncbi:hypothetical protein E4U53_007834 [Claviceps sorghi]|nr:hypothetical protein E4U53_007834 [Claviceps sorghi]
MSIALLTKERQPPSNVGGRNKLVFYEPTRPPRQCDLVGSRAMRVLSCCGAVTPEGGLGGAMGRRVLCEVLARGAAWLTDVCGIVVVSFVAQRWTETCGAVAPGMAGILVALLVDSWQTVALSGHPLAGVAPMGPGTTVVCDAVAFAVTLGGISSLLVSSITDGEGDEDYLGYGRRGDLRFGRASMTVASMWFMGAVFYAGQEELAWCLDAKIRKHNTDVCVQGVLFMLLSGAMGPMS